MTEKSTSKIRFSAIALFKEDENSQYLKKLCQDIECEFGGHSANVLPPHITLLKWEADKWGDLSVNTALSGHVHTADIVLSEPYSALWYEYQGAEVLRATQDMLVSALKQKNIKDSDIHPYKTFHSTLAYKDYSLDKLYTILNSTTVRNAKNKLVLTLDKLVFCTVENGQWVMV